MTGWPGDVESVTITWLDDRQETCKCNRFEVAEGELRLWTQYKGGYDPDRRYHERGFPFPLRSYEINRIS